MECVALDSDLLTPMLLVAKIFFTTDAMQALIFFRACVGFGIAGMVHPSYMGSKRLLCVMKVFLHAEAGAVGAHVAYTLFMEYVAPEHRGRSMSLIEGFWTLGAIHLAAMAWLILPDLGWRVLVLVAAAPLLALIAVYPLLKESPHWLLANNRHEEAMVRMLELSASSVHCFGVDAVLLRLSPSHG